MLEEIYIIGLGLDNPDFVDATYLQEVFKHAFEGTILYFDYFDKEKRNIYRETCKRNGFVGQYGISDSTTGEKYLF